MQIATALQKLQLSGTSLTLPMLAPLKLLVRPPAAESFYRKQNVPMRGNRLLTKLLRFAYEQSDLTPLCSNLITPN